MLKYLIYLAGLLLIGSLCTGCNPDCTTIPGLRVSSSFNPAGFEVLITSNVPADLHNKSVFFGEKEVDPEYIRDVGLRVVVPDGLSGNTDIRIEDGDCVDYVNVPGGFSVVEESFFIDNPDFISPIPPQIIIPTLPPNFPPSVDQAWLSPDNVDYCLWFIMLKDTLSDGTIVETNTIDQEESFEQTTCSGDPGKFYFKNKIFGIIDKEANLINIWIDRRGINRGIEEYRGQFIDMANTPYAGLDRYTGPLCGSNVFTDTGHMLLLTSQRNGRQTLAFQKTP
jgi:hypothetical protein